MRKNFPLFTDTIRQTEPEAGKLSIFVQTCQIESTNVNVWFTSVAVTKNSPDPVWGQENFGAGDRARTGTSLTSRDFKSRASANSATPANRLLYTTTNAGPRQEKIARRRAADRKSVKFT